MAIARWGTPNTESQIDSGVLNSLANGSTSARMGYDNSSSRDLYARIVVELGSLTPTTGGSITLRVLNRRGSNDEDVTAGLDSYTMPLTTNAGAKRVIFPMVTLYPFVMGFVIQNNAGVVLAASGNGVYIQGFDEEVS